MNLAQFLTRELEGNSLRDLEAKTGISHTALKRIADRSLQGYPDLETLKKIAEAYGQPLWRVLEMAGLDLGLIARNRRLVTNVTSLIEHEPLFRQLFERMIDAKTEEIEAVLIYFLFDSASAPLLAVGVKYV